MPTHGAKFAAIKLMSEGVHRRALAFKREDSKAQSAGPDRNVEQSAERWP